MPQVVKASADASPPTAVSHSGGKSSGSPARWLANSVSSALAMAAGGKSSTKSTHRSHSKRRGSFPQSLVGKLHIGGSSAAGGAGAASGSAASSVSSRFAGKENRHEQPGGPKGSVSASAETAWVNPDASKPSSSIGSVQVGAQPQTTASVVLSVPIGKFSPEGRAQLQRAREAAESASVPVSAAAAVEAADEPGGEPSVLGGAVTMRVCGRRLQNGDKCAQPVGFVRLAPPHRL